MLTACFPSPLTILLMTSALHIILANTGVQPRPMMTGSMCMGTGDIVLMDARHEIKLN